MKKNRLIVDYQYEFDLIGIISSVKFYKLAWAINNKLSVRMVKNEDYVLFSKKNKEIMFSNYFLNTEALTLQLFRNKTDSSTNDFMISEQPHLDYILKIESSSLGLAAEEVAKALREVQWIEYIALLEIEGLKSKDNFIS